MAATTSDHDNLGVWGGRYVDVARSDGKTIIEARTVLRTVSNVWVDWIDWKIEIDKDYNAVIEEETPDRKIVYEGKAVPVTTFTTHKFP